MIIRATIPEQLTRKLLSGIIAMGKGKKILVLEGRISFKD
jgi:hypothetical protein